MPAILTCFGCRWAIRPALVTRLLAVFAAMLVASTAANAQTYSWTQPTTGSSGTWSTATWSPSIPSPGTTTIVNFNVLAGSGAYTFSNDAGPFLFNGANLNDWSTNLLTVDVGGAGFGVNIGGSNGFIANNGPGNVTISGAGGVNLLSGLTLSGAGNGTVTISSPITGSGGVNVNAPGLGVFSLTGTNTFSGGVTLTSGNLSLGNTAALGSAINTLTINGGTLRGGSVTVANAITANADLNLSGGTLTLNGVVSGAGGVKNTGVGTLTLTGANTYAGATTVQSYISISTGTGPILTLSGLNGSITSTQPILIGKNSTLQLTDASGAQNSNRIPNAAPLRFDGGRFSYTGVAGSSETLGDITLSGHIRLTATPTGVSTITAGNLIREDNATAIISYSSGTFGNIVSATNFTKMTFASGVTPFAVGNGTGTQTAIVPWMLAGTSTTNPRDLVTYDAINGLQVIPYTNATFIAQIANTAGFTPAAVTNQNVHLNGAGTVDLGGGTVVINSLTTNNSTITFTDGTLKVASGMLVNWDNVVWGTGATLDFGTSTGYIHVSWNQVFNSTSSITGSGGVVVSGEGSGGSNVTSFENSTGNPFTGGLYVLGNANLGFTADNQLGASGGNITLGGGRLAYNLASNLTINRDIKLGPAGGGINFNVVASGGTTGTASAATVLTLGGTISGPGTFFKEGVGIANLTGTNTYTGGTVVTGGTLQFTSDANLGASGTKITLNGGTLQPLAAGTFARPIEVNASSTILTNVNVTLSSPLSTVGQLYGTANPTITKTGTGTLTLTATSPNLSGNVVLSAGGITLAGLNGSAPQVNSVAIASGATLTLDNTGGYHGNRLGDLAQMSLGGGTLNYIAGSTATGDPAERLGSLLATAAGSRVNIDGSAATSPTILRFSNLNTSAGTMLFSGTNLGGTSGNFTRILFDTTPTLSVVGTILNAFYSSTSGGASEGPAAYDPTRGVILFTATPVSGTTINNFSPDNVPLAAAFTTTGNTVAKTGASVYSLTLDAGSTLTLDGGNAASATNGNTPDGTLLLSGGSLTSQNGAKSIVVGTASSPTIAFGPALATITTTSDLMIASGIGLSGTGGFIKAGAGVLTLNGTYNVTGGPLAVNAGIFTLGSSGTVTNGTVLTIASGATYNGGGVTTTYGATTVNGTLNQGGGTVTYGGLTVNNAFTLGTGGAASTTALAGTGSIDLANGTLTITGTSSTFAGNIAGVGGSVVNNSSGTLALNGVNTYTGGTSHTSGTSTTGTLSTNNASGFGTGPIGIISTVASSNRTLNISLPVNGTGTFTNDINLNLSNASSTFLITNSGTTGTVVTLAGKISGTVTNLFEYNGTASTGNVLRLTNAANDFTATTGIQIFEGILAITSNGALGNAANSIDINTSAGGGLRFDANNIVLNRDIRATFSGAAFFMNGNTGTVAGVLSGTTTLAVNGTGTLILANAANTYSGGLTVGNATVLVNGLLPGAATPPTTTINTGGMIGGTGTIGSAAAQRSITVNNGGSLTGGNPTTAAGAAPGVLTVNGNISLGGGSNLLVRITGGASSAVNGGSSGGLPTSPANNGFLLQSTGTLTLNPTANIVIDGTGVSFLPNQPYSYVVAQSPSASGIIVTDQTVFQTIGFQGSDFSLVGDASGFVYLSFTPVPEPATVLGLAAGVLGLGGLVRRRLRSA